MYRKIQDDLLKKYNYITVKRAVKNYYDFVRNFIKCFKYLIVIYMNIPVLTKRESDVLSALSMGLRAEDVAELFSAEKSFSLRTVNHYCVRIKDKCLVGTYLEAIRLFVKNDPLLKAEIIDQSSFLLPELTKPPKITRAQWKIISNLNDEALTLSDKLGISHRTVHYHLRTLYSNFKVRNKMELYIRLLSLGILEN